MHSHSKTEKFEYLNYLYQEMDLALYAINRMDSDENDIKQLRLITFYKNEAEEHFDKTLFKPLTYSPLDAQTILFFHRANILNVSLELHCDSENLVNHYQIVFYRNERNTFNRILALLIDYSCSYKRYILDSQAKKIYEILCEYYSDNKTCEPSSNFYNDYHPHHDIGFLIFLIYKHISPNEIARDSHIASIFQVIQNFTGINAKHLVPGSDLYHFYLNLEKYLIENNIPFKNRDIIFDDLYEKWTQKCPIISIVLSNSTFTYALKLLLDARLISSRDLIQFNLDNRRGLNYRYNNFEDIESIKNYYSYINLDEKEKLFFLRLSVIRKKYTAALLLFSLINQFHLSKCENIPANIDRYTDFIHHLVLLIDNRVTSDSIINIMIFHENKYEKKYFSSQCYIQLLSKMDLIVNWNSINEIFMNKCKKDEFKIICGKNEIISQPKEIIISPEEIIVDAIRFTSPKIMSYVLQQFPEIKIESSFWMEIGNVKIERDLADILNIVKQFIFHDPGCFHNSWDIFISSVNLTKYNINPKIAYFQYWHEIYDRKYTVSVLENNKILSIRFDEIQKLLSAEYRLLRIYQCYYQPFVKIFLCAMQDEKSSIFQFPKDVMMLIAFAMFSFQLSEIKPFDQQTITSYKTKYLPEKAYEAIGLTMFAAQSAEVKRIDNQPRSEIKKQSMV